MSETVFSLLNFVALAGWIGLAIASPLKPGARRDTILRVSGRWIPSLLCVAYVGLLGYSWGTAPGGGFQSLEAVQVLFSTAGIVLAAWTHFLAFDLFIGRWMVDDASSAGRSRLPLLVALPMTFLFGPAGVLLYLAGQSLCRSNRRVPSPGDS
ncbi:MAG: DUF4281 domain-containing protein [Planctomycetes bacterium]|nr:DUF4281 domain-containing protein [Planctomycetota bacterium]